MPLTGLPAGHAGAAPPLEPGEVRVTKHAVLVGTGSSPVQLGQVRPPGKKVMAAADWARGSRLVDGERLQ
jgi:methionyl-tRNA formyltransferase